MIPKDEDLLRRLNDAATALNTSMLDEIIEAVARRLHELTMCPIGIPPESRGLCSAGTCPLCLAEHNSGLREELYQMELGAKSAREIAIEQCARAIENYSHIDLYRDQGAAVVRALKSKGAA